MQEDEERQRSERGGSHAARGRAHAGRERAAGAALGPGLGQGSRGQDSPGAEPPSAPRGRTALPRGTPVAPTARRWLFEKPSYVRAVTPSTSLGRAPDSSPLRLQHLSVWYVVRYQNWTQDSKRGFP